MIRSLPKKGLKRTFGDVIIGDKVEEIFIAVINGLIADDPIGSIEIGDIFEGTVVKILEAGAFVNYDCLPRQVLPTLDQLCQPRHPLP